MTLSELKTRVLRGYPEVHVLANEGDVYLVQVISYGKENLLMDGKNPMRFHSLAECSQGLAQQGVKKGYLIQNLAADEMIGSVDDHSHVCRQEIVFH